MKFYPIAIAVLFTSSLLYAQQSCQQMLASLEKAQKAYGEIDREHVTKGDSSTVIGRFVEAGDAVMSQCPQALSFEQRHTLRKRVEEAKNVQHANTRPLRDPRGRQGYSRGVIKTH